MTAVVDVEGVIKLLNILKLYLFCQGDNGKPGEPGMAGEMGLKVVHLLLFQLSISDGFRTSNLYLTRPTQYGMFLKKDTKNDYFIADKLYHTGNSVTSSTLSELIPLKRLY